METGKKKIVRPPSEYGWIEDKGDIEKLGEIHAKLEAISCSFGYYRDRNMNPESAAAVYGYWHILNDICHDIAAIIKLDYWTGEAGTGKQKEGDNAV
jgi:hypothetical protein